MEILSEEVFFHVRPNQKNEYRCKCNRLLGIYQQFCSKDAEFKDLQQGHIDIACPKCGLHNKIMI